MLLLVLKGLGGFFGAVEFGPRELAELSAQ